MTDQLSDRETRAERYFEQDLKGQREWYGKRASAYKTGPSFLVLSSLLPERQLRSFRVFTPAIWVPPVTA
jgi:hypothetical protein